MVFGATGDLTKRKLIPALYFRFRAGQMSEKSRIIGVSRSPWDDAKMQEVARDAVTEFVDPAYQDEEMIEQFVACFSYVANDVTNKDGWADLKTHLRDDEEIVRAFYLAVAPNIFEPICEFIAETGYWRPTPASFWKSRSATISPPRMEINDAVAKVFHEDQVYRIDHYLGKETVQNLLALRFANALFEPIWNSAHIDHVQITVAETVGAGTRGYYDDSGALRDMIQNHILQLLCLVAMEPPASGEANALRDEKLKVLRSLRPITGETHLQGARCAASIAASPPRRPRSNPIRTSCRDERKGSHTETFVALKAEIDNWRWAGVPFYIRTGKRMAAKRVRDRHPVLARSRIRSSRMPRARRSPTSSSSACSRTRASSSS